jgi:REP element-mobilizing transposase RayT
MRYYCRIKMRVRRPVQQQLEFRTHGGRRAGAGRPKDTTRNLLPHGRRPTVTTETPVHVTLRVKADVVNLRSKRSFRIIAKALEAAREWSSARVVHYSVQGNHVHLVAEASDRRVLARRIAGLEVRIARAMNKLMNRTGGVFADRYHARALRTPLEVRRVIEYVLKNRAHHVGRHRAAAFDAYSSARWFDGWRSSRALELELDNGHDAGTPLVRPPRSWLLRIGWRRHGLLEV